MATVSDITNTPLSGLNHIDALLDSGPDWNYFSSNNTLQYTFSVASGTEAGKTGLQAFSASQQAAVRTAIGYIAQVTGIQFLETAVGTDAQIHLSNTDLAGANVTGLCSWLSNYSYSGTQLVSYDADAYVYLDNAEWNAQNSNLTPGGNGYETLLHELGHALGLKHSFETTDDNKAVLPTAQDNTANTLMSYTDLGGPYTTYRQDDIAALNWLYGRDGLAGTMGINSTTGARYITGTNGADTLTGTDASDTLEGDGGNDMLFGGNGIDTAVFRGLRSEYTFTNLANGNLQVVNNTGSANDGTDILSSIEVLRFSDGSIQRADILSPDTTAPLAPSLAVTKNAAGFVQGDKPIVTGAAEANATVTVYDANNQAVGSVKADGSGAFSLTLSHFEDALNQQIHATATDAAGNISPASSVATFNVNAVYTPGSILAALQGVDSVASTIQLVHTLVGIAQQTTGSGNSVGAHAQASSMAVDIPEGQAQLVGTPQNDIAHLSLMMV
ncbi:MAG: matrixin family metalloprotease [Oxalobacteraceae bacterium]|nr:MAG: matrixin family metalloprotease [Oxalobacteraceae bacterium]